MRLLEWQAKKLLSEWGLPVPKGALLKRPAQLAQAVRKAGGFPVILKVQVYAGGRGKAGGIRKVTSLAKGKTIAKDLLAKRLVTPQTGTEGVAVKSLLVEQGLTILKEFYVSVLIDRSRQLPVVVAAREGGMAIEELAKEHPEGILTTPFDPFLGLLSHQARRIVGWLGIPSERRETAVRQMVKLAKGFFSTDATLVEVNPWALTKELGMTALDGKITVDDNALYRYPALEKIKTADADTPSEAKSRVIGINYVGLDGAIGCMVNGAGLAMATMDLIKLHGGDPANFLDVGGGANAAQVREAFKLILADKNVKAVLVNIFGGIMKCDVIAAGIIEAAKSMRIKVPLVVRLEGTNVDAGRKMLKDSGLGFLTAGDMDEAAQKAVQAANAPITLSPSASVRPELVEGRTSAQDRLRRRV